MTTTLNESPAKWSCVQFETETDSGKDPPRPAPLTITLTIVNNAVETHPAPIQSLCLSIFQKFSALKNKERQQLNTLSRLAEDSFLPHLVRLTFEL